MKSFIKFLSFSIIAVIATTNLKAQDLRIDLNYNYSIPLSGFKNDIISNGSPRGVTGDLLYNINRKWAVGLYGGFQDYYQKYDRQVYDLQKNQQISAVVSNSVQTTPLLAKVLFMPLGNKLYTVQPYISGAVGGNVVDFTQYLGEFPGEDNSLNFAAQAGAGLSIAFTKTNSAGFHFGATYNYVPYKQNGYSNLDNLGLEAGFHFKLK